MPRMLLAPVLCAALAGVVVVAAGCPQKPPPTKKPKVTAPTLGSAPLRRLTQEELNHSLRDLFTGIDLPAVSLNDGDGKGFDGDVSRQTPSDLAVEQLRTGAVAVAKAAVQRKDLLLSRQPSGDPADQAAVGHETLATLLPRAFRRPAEQRELDLYDGFFDQALAANDFDVALELTVGAVLQSPSFVYRLELGAGPVGDGVAVGSFEMASRLSYLLWSTMPDQALFDAATSDALKTPEQLEAQARRMLADQKAHDAILSFHRQWLDLDKVLTSNKDAATFPQWNDDLRKAMRTEADKMIEEVVFGSGNAKLQALFTTTKTRVNGALAAVYGVPAPAHDWDLVDLPADQRAGLITSPAFLSARAHQVFGSPVLRGVFVLDRFLCEAPPPPPPNVNINPPDPSTEPAPTTNRQRFDQHANDPSCIGCHATIDGVGFGLEAFDAIGQFRTTDNALPVDASGIVDGTPFNGAVELGADLAKSTNAQQCFARQWLTFGRGRVGEAGDASHDDAVEKAFAAADGDIQELLVAIVKEPGFRTLPKAASGVTP